MFWCISNKRSGFSLSLFCQAIKQYIPSLQKLLIQFQCGIHKMWYSFFCRFFSLSIAFSTWRSRNAACYTHHFRPVPSKSQLCTKQLCFRSFVCTVSHVHWRSTQQMANRLSAWFDAVKWQQIDRVVREKTFLRKEMNQHMYFLLMWYSALSEHVPHWGGELKCCVEKFQVFIKIVQM